MEIFQKLGNVANKTCKYTTQQTNRLATITKYKWKMSEYKSRIDDLYEDLGKVVYENRVREHMEDSEERIDEKCKEIDDLASKIETCRKKILRLNNKKQCPNCYTEIYDVFNYCPNCGKPQKSIQKEEDKEETQDDIEQIQLEFEEPDTNEKIELDSYVDPDKIKNNYTEGEETKKID